MANNLDRLYHVTTKLLYAAALEKRFKTWLLERHIVPESEHPTISANYVYIDAYVIIFLNNCWSWSKNFNLKAEKLKIFRFRPGKPRTRSEKSISQMRERVKIFNGEKN